MSRSGQRGKGKTALVTGASGGIGLDLARLLAADGFDLVLLARSRDALERAAGELRGRHGVHTHVIARDLADPATPQSVYDELAARSVAVEILVNNAGFGVHGAFHESSLEQELELLQVNIVALTHLTKLFLRDMVARRSGRILQVASTAAFVPGTFMSCYYASKAYVLSHGVALARELRGTGLGVTILCPGPTRTGFQQRAGMTEARLMRLRPMDSMAVARAGYAGLMRGKLLVVPGLVNKLTVLASRLAPRMLLAKATEGLNRDRR